MSGGRLLRYLDEVTRLDRYPALRRWHHRGRDKALIAFNRDSVARAVAIGFFFGILTPVAQIVFSLVAAIALRANLLVAAGSTLITNPFLRPFVYSLAYRIGLFRLGGGAEPTPQEQTEALQDLMDSEEAAELAFEVTHWYETLTQWLESVGLPFLIGVVTLATCAALTGYLVVYAGWGLIARRRGK